MSTARFPVGLAAALTIGLSAVASASFLDHAGPDTTPVPAPPGPLIGDQTQVALAYGGGVYLALWRDHVSFSTDRVYAARLKPDGSPLDATPLLLGDVLLGQQMDPAVAYDGTRFVAVWNLKQSSLRAVYIDPQGALGATFLQVGPASGQVAAAGGGGKALIVYQLTGTNAGIWGQAVTDGGLSGAAFQIAAGAGLELPAVAGSGDEYVVAWDQLAGAQTSIFAARVSLAAPPTPPTVTATGQLDDKTGNIHNLASCAYDTATSSFLVSWTEKPSTPFEVHARTISQTGSVGADVTLGASASGHGYARTQAATIDGNFVVAWEDVTSTTGTLVGCQVNPSNGAAGAVTAISSYPATETTLLADQWRASQLASEGTRGRLAWVRRSLRSTSLDVMSTPIEAGALGAAAPAELDLGVATQRSAQVAANGSGYLAVWEDARDLPQNPTQGSDIFGQRFDAAGQPVGGPFVISQAAGDQRDPAVAALPGGDYLVAWSDARNGLQSNYSLPPTDFTAIRELYMTRVGADGTVRSPAGVYVDDGTMPREPRDRFPHIAVDATNRRWLVTWDGDSYPIGGNTSLRLDNYLGTAIVSETGAVSGVQQIRITATRLCGGRAAFGGSGYLLVAEAGCVREVEPSIQGAAADVVGIRIDADGVPDLAPADLVQLPAKVDTFRMAPAVAGRADGTFAVVWEEYPKAPIGSAPGDTGDLRGAIVPPTGAPVLQDLVISSTAAPARPRWPTIVATGSGFLLSFVDESGAAYVTRALRLFADLRPNPLDGDAAHTSGGVVAVSSAPTLAELTEPDPIGAGLGVDGNGQVLLGFAAAAPAPTGRLHARVLGGRNQGDACDPAALGAGCGDGRCERDAENAGGGLCCATACSGPCQKCTADGCVGVPAADAACGMVSCAALSTACRQYDDAPAACLGFNRCAASDDLESCTISHPINEGGACAAPGCSQMGSCAGGECVCPDAPQDYGLRRKLPPSCAIAGPGARPSGGGEAVGLALLFLVGAALLRRRRAAWILALVVLVAGCADQGAFAIDLRFEDGSLQETAFVRLVVKDTAAGAGFAPAAPMHDAAHDETIRNIDIDGDGAREIVIDLGAQFPFARRTTFLKLTAANATRRAVTIGAQAIDRFGNPVAASKPVASTLPGGKVVLDLGRCAADDCRGEHAITPGAPLALDPRGHAVAALAARPSSDAGDGLVAAGLPAFDAADDASAAAFPNRGRVVLVGPNATRDALAVGATLDGAAAGDQLGAAVALGDVTGDGALDLVVGAPGVDSGRGRVYVLSAVSAAGPLDLQAAAAFDAPSAGEHLGAALALADLDGDGVLDVVAGAPADDAGDGRGAVYGLSAAAGALAQLGAVRGDAGAHLGRALDASTGLVAAGAPGANQVVVLSPADLMAGTAPRTWQASTGGGLGTTVALSDIDADGAMEVIAGAPAGLGTLLLATVPAEARALDDGDVVRAVIPARSPTGGRLGATLGRIATRYGDMLYLAAPPDDASAPGLAYAVTATSLAAADKTLDLGATPPPAAVSASLPGTRLLAGTGADLLGGDAAGGIELVFGDDKGNLYVYSFGGAL